VSCTAQRRGDGNSAGVSANNNTGGTCSAERLAAPSPGHHQQPFIHGDHMTSPSFLLGPPPADMPHDSAAPGLPPACSFHAPSHQMGDAGRGSHDWGALMPTLPPPWQQQHTVDSQQHLPPFPPHLPPPQFGDIGTLDMNVLNGLLPNLHDTQPLQQQQQQQQPPFPLPSLPPPALPPPGKDENMHKWPMQAHVHTFTRYEQSTSVHTYTRIHTGPTPCSHHAALAACATRPPNRKRSNQASAGGWGVGDGGPTSELATNQRQRQRRMPCPLHSQEHPQQYQHQQQQYPQQQQHQPLFPPFDFGGMGMGGWNGGVGASADDALAAAMAAVGGYGGGNMPPIMFPGSLEGVVSISDPPHADEDGAKMVCQVCVSVCMCYVRRVAHAIQTVVHVKRSANSRACLILQPSRAKAWSGSCKYAQACVCTHFPAPTGCWVRQGPQQPQGVPP